MNTRLRRECSGSEGVMANVLFIAVREDIDRAETLADMFEMAGIGVISPFNGESLEACDAAILVWSRAASRSRHL
jgi:hypothetical protein